MLTHAAHTSYMFELATETEAFCVFWWWWGGCFYVCSHTFEVVTMLPFSSYVLMRRAGSRRFSLRLSFFSLLCILPTTALVFFDSSSRSRLCTHTLWCGPNCSFDIKSTSCQTSISDTLSKAPLFRPCCFPSLRPLCLLIVVLFFFFFSDLGCHVPDLNQSRADPSR